MPSLILTSASQQAHRPRPPHLVPRLGSDGEHAPVVREVDAEDGWRPLRRHLVSAELHVDRSVGGGGCEMGDSNRVANGCGSGWLWSRSVEVSEVGDAADRHSNLGKTEYICLSATQHSRCLRLSTAVSLIVCMCIHAATTIRKHSQKTVELACPREDSEQAIKYLTSATGRPITRPAPPLRL